MRKVKLCHHGQIVAAELAVGEEADGRVAGLGSHVLLRGVGLVRMRDVYPEHELTDACGPDDMCWGAEVISISGVRRTGGSRG